MHKNTPTGKGVQWGGATWRESVDIPDDGEVVPVAIGAVS